MEGEKKQAEGRQGTGKGWGVGVRNRSRRVLAMAQWVLLISQWQCQGSWQGPDARHQLQRLVNRLLSRRHICTAMVAHTHTGIWAHAYTMAGTQTDTDLLSLQNLVKVTVNLFVCCILTYPDHVKKKHARRTGTPNTTITTKISTFTFASLQMHS